MRDVCRLFYALKKRSVIATKRSIDYEQIK